MWISKKRLEALEKRVADLEKKQSQPSGKEQAFLLAALNIKLSNVDALGSERS